MYNKICVAVDGSDTSFLAVKSAAKLASQLSAELLIVHVIRNMKVPRELKRFVKQNSLDQLRQEALEGAGKEIVEHATGIAKELGIEVCDKAIVQGDPAGAIVAAADSHECDLIVVGTRGLGQVEGMLIGSISRKITSIARVNVLVVK